MSDKIYYNYLKMSKKINLASCLMCWKHIHDDYKVLEVPGRKHMEIVLEALKPIRATK